MSLGLRKLAVLALIVGAVLTANLWFLVHWLQGHGVIDAAQHICTEYLTGTAVTVIIALLILLVTPDRTRVWRRRCSVCEHVLVGRGRYCSECGSRVH